MALPFENDLVRSTMETKRVGIGIFAISFRMILDNWLSSARQATTAGKPPQAPIEESFKDLCFHLEV